MAVTVLYNGGPEPLDLKGTELNLDDNIGLILKKIAYVTGQPWYKLYAFYKRRIGPSQKVAVLTVFVKNVFKREKRIPATKLTMAMRCHFGDSVYEGDLEEVESDYAILDIPEALTLVKKLCTKVTHIIEPLGFHYVYNGFLEYVPYDPSSSVNVEVIDTTVFNNELSMTLQNYDITDGVVYVADHAHLKNKASYLLPYMVKDAKDKEVIASTRKLIKDLSDVEEAIRKVESDDLTDKNYINFLQLRLGFDTGRRLDLLRIFEYMHASAVVPIVKLKLKTNAFFKVWNGHVEKLVADKDEYKKLTAGTGNDNEYVMFKMPSVTVILHDDGTYNVRMNFRVQARETEATVRGYISTINRVVISEMAKAMMRQGFKDVSRIPEDVLTVSYEDCQIYKTMYNGAITSRSFQFKFGNFKNLINSRFYPYFEIVPTVEKNILHLQYKKVDNYSQYTNVKAFIAQHVGLGRDEVIVRLKNTFTLTDEEAEREFDRWSISNEAEMVADGSGASKFKAKYDNFVNVKIRLTSTLDMNYLITGAKSQIVVDRITWLLKKLAKMSHNKYKEKDAEFLKYFNNEILGKHENPKVTVADVLADDSGDVEFQKVEEDEMDDDLMALEAEFIGSEDGEVDSATLSDNVSTNAGASPDDAAVKKKSDILNRLHTADKNLFIYKVNKNEKRRDYASKCSSSDKRQPVVITKEELDAIKTRHPDAITGALQTGSTPDLASKNYYICPAIWCPKSRAAISFEEYSKAGKKCPGAADETPVLFQSAFWGKDDEGLKRKHHPGFLDTYVHPDKLCLPCCFKMSQDKKKKKEVCTTNIQEHQQVEVDESVLSAAAAADVKDRYIKAETFSPLDIGRYGLVPKDLQNALGGEVCGIRHDGTGTFKEGKSVCYLRKGIIHGSQSFLTCLSVVLGFKNAADVIKRIRTHLDIETYISLENGRLLKLFINDDLDIEDDVAFKEFKKWLEAPQQERYVVRYNIGRLLENVDDVARRKALLREFLIWGSFKKFMDYLTNDTVEKEHVVLIDLVNMFVDWLNPKRVRIIVIEVDPDTGKVYALCPSRTLASPAQMKNCAMMIRRNGYYEPVYHVVNTGIKAGTKEELVLSDLPVAFIRFLYKNCNSTTEIEKNKKNMKVYLASKGIETRAYVIDYNYRVCGLLLRKNLFIPYFDENKLEIFDIDIRDRFIYYDEVPLHRCSLDLKEIRSIMATVRNYLQDSRYTITHVIRNAKSGPIDGILINEGSTFIPLMLKNTSKTFREFGDDLDIFVGDDEIASRLARQLHLILSREENSDIRDELMFLMDAGNMIPWSWRVKRLHKLLKELSMTIPEHILKDVTSKVVRRLLPSHSTLTVSASRFNTHENEYVLSYRDMKQGKLTELWELQKNPFKHITETLYNMEVTAYQIEEAVKTDSSSTRTHKGDADDIYLETPPCDYEEVPVKYRKMLKGYVVSMVKEYSRESLMRIFYRAANGNIEMGVLEANIKKSLHEDVKDFGENPSYVALYKKDRAAMMTLDSFLEAIDKPGYYSSFYELGIWADVCGVNVVTLGHKTLKNPDGIRVFTNGSDRWMILLHSYDRFQVRDRFDIISYKNKVGSFVYKRDEIPEEFMSMIDKKTRVYEIAPP